MCLLASSCPSLGSRFLICERQTVASGFSQQKMASLLVLFFWLSLCSPSPAETLAPGRPGGPPTTLGTPLGQWVLGWRQRQHPGTSCNSQPTPRLPPPRSAPLSTNCRVASRQLPPRPQASASQWIKGSLESLSALHQPHRPSCTGVVSMVLRLPSPALGGGQERYKPFSAFLISQASLHVREAHP